MPQQNNESASDRRGAAPRAPHPAHRVALDGRERVSVTGVKDVSSFDENGVVMETVCGVLTLDGEELGISRLDLSCGEVDVTGRVIGLYYVDPGRRKKRLFGRE